MSKLQHCKLSYRSLRVMNRQIGFDLPQNSSALSFVHPHRLSSWSLKRNCFRLQSSVYSSLRQENRVHRYISTGSRPGLCPICCSSVGTSAPTTEQPDRKAWPVSAAKAAVCLLAAYAWCRYSALSPGSLFCSASLAASTTQSGIRSAGGSAWAGLAAGCLHSLSGPDHLAALTPLTIGRSFAKASLLGAWWGFGHCIGQLILGLLMLFLKDQFHSVVPVLDKYSSLTIGLTLVAIGAMGLFESFTEGPSQVEVKQQTPQLALESAGASVRPAESGCSSQPTPSTSGESRLAGQGFSLWTLATGVVYGLQPDALFVIIPALALPTKLAAAAYMGMFVAGTVAAMGSYTAFIGATSRVIQSKGSWLKVERLSAMASLVALLMGLTVVCSGSLSFIPFVKVQ